MRTMRSFLFGIIAALGALFLEMLLGIIINSPQDLTDIFFNRLTPLLVLSVLIEEIIKFIFIFRRRLELEIYFNNIGNLKGIKKEIFFNSFFIGIGFSVVELLFIFFSSPSLRDILNIKMAIAGILIIHTVTSCVMGRLLAKQDASTFSLGLTALPVAVAAHLFYNFLIIYPVRPFFIILYLAFFFLLFAAMARGVIRKEAAKMAS